MTTKTSNAEQTISPADVIRLFADGYRAVEVGPDGAVREANGNDNSNGNGAEEVVTRTLKTERTWY